MLDAFVYLGDGRRPQAGAEAPADAAAWSVDDAPPEVDADRPGRASGDDGRLPFADDV